ncbi:MAG TPA: hypothetical protein VIL44_02755 [Micromonospora sp.]
MRQPPPVARFAAEEPCLVIDHENLRGVRFTGTRLVSLAVIGGSTFTECDFRGITVEEVAFGASTQRCEYYGCVFDGARLGWVEPGVARFVRCSFRNVRVRTWRAGALDLIECTFSGRIDRGVIAGSVPPGQPIPAGCPNHVDGNDFRDLVMPRLDFVGGVDLTRQRLPVGSDVLYLSDLDAALKAAEVAFPTCPAPLRPAVRRRLDRLRRLRAGGQQQAWLPARRFVGADPAAARWLTELWRREGFSSPTTG